MNVTHKQIVSGMTTAGPLAILLSRFILWVNADSVERELRKEVEDLTERLDGVNKLLEERYESAWKVRKDGKARYRKVATKVLVNAWVTETEPIVWATAQALPQLTWELIAGNSPATHGLRFDPFALGMCDTPMKWHTITWNESK